MRGPRFTFCEQDAFAEDHGEVSSDFLRFRVLVAIAQEDVVQGSRIKQNEALVLGKRRARVDVNLESVCSVDQGDRRVIDRESGSRRTHAVETVVTGRAAVLFVELDVDLARFARKDALHVAPQERVALGSWNIAKRRTERRDEDRVREPQRRGGDRESDREAVRRRSLGSSSSSAGPRGSDDDEELREGPQIQIERENVH